jgi:hypothetical protein
MDKPCEMIVRTTEKNANEALVEKSNHELTL